MTTKHISEVLGRYGENFISPQQEAEVVHEIRIEEGTAKAIGLPNGQITYIIIYHAVTKRFGLTLLESALVSTIHTLSKKEDKCCYMSQGTFASLFNVSIPTIASALDNLERLRLTEKSAIKSHLKTNRLRVSSEVRGLIEETRAQIELRKNAPQR